MKSIASGAAWLRVLLAVAAVSSSATAMARDVGGREIAFAAENEAAMNRMMAAMAVKPSGSVDRDFVAMMVPHHQGAIEMAVAELRYGSNEQLRRIAQEIVVGQHQEMAAMKMAVGLPLPPSMPAPTQAVRIAYPPSPSRLPDGGRTTR